MYAKDVEYGPEVFRDESQDARLTVILWIIGCVCSSL